MTVWVRETRLRLRNITFRKASPECNDGLKDIDVEWSYSDDSVNASALGLEVDTEL